MTTKPHANAAASASEGVHARVGGATASASRAQTYCAAANAAAIAAPLYFVDAARPPASPAATNNRVADQVSDRALRARTSSASAVVTNSVMSTSVIAKCDSLT